MKKIIAIAVIAITVAVTAFNVYQAIPQFIVKPQTHEKIQVRAEDRNDSDGRAGLAVFVTFNLVCLTYFFIKYEIWRHSEKLARFSSFDSTDKTNFYNDVLSEDGDDISAQMVFTFFSFINGLVIFCLLCWLVYLIIR